MAQAPGVQTDVINRLRSILAEIAEVEPREVPLDLPLFGAGGLMDALELDSLDALVLGLELSEEFGVEPGALVDPNVRTVGDLVVLVASGGKSG
jgi:acyl carrier protein